MSKHLNALVASDVKIRGDKGESIVNVLFDTGASQSFIKREIAEKVGTIVKLPDPRHFIVADGRTVTITDGITLTLQLADEQIIDTFLVTDSSVADVILGESTMRKFGMKIDLEHGAVYASLKEKPSLQNLKPTLSIFSTQENHPMQKLIARLREIFALAAEATEEQILAKLNETHAASQQLVTTKNKVIAVLGVKPETTDAEIESALAIVTKAKDLRAKVITTLSLDATASDEAIIAAVSTAKTSTGELAALTAKVTDLQLKDFDRTFASIIDEALKSGKVLPVQRDDKQWMEAQRNFAKSDPAQFAAFWGRQPVVGPTQKLPTDTNAAAQASGVTPEALALSKQIGVDEATLRKYNPAAS